MPKAIDDLPDDVDREIMDALMGKAPPPDKDTPPKFYEVIHRGDTDLPAPVLAQVYEEEGVVPIYDIRTGERSFTNRNLLPAQLKKVDDKGRRMFTYNKPEKAPELAGCKCLLHPDVRKPEYDTWGFPTCSKSHLASPLMLKLHMEHRHRIEYQTIKDEETRAKEEAVKTRDTESLELQRQIAMAALSKTLEETIPKRTRSKASPETQ